MNSIHDLPKPTGELMGLGYFTDEDRGRGYRGFSVETCPTCGGPVIGPNSVNILEDRTRLERVGLVYVPPELVPSEQHVDFHDDDGGEEEWWCDADDCGR